MLHSNGIHTIPAKTFSDLQALQVLKMSYNKVQKLQKDNFYGLRSLTWLLLDHNSIEFINPEVFNGLTFLRLVHLEGNQLTKLHPDTFVSLRYLQIFKASFVKYLYLSDNFLSSLHQEMVSYMPNLESLYLHGNSWTCDCHLKWLSDWIQEKPGFHLSKRKENSRFQVLLNGTLAIKEVDIQDRGQYLCSASNALGTDHLHVTLSMVSYPPRILERRNKEIIVHSGSTVELKCSAEGRPSPMIYWILANQTAVSESSEGKRQALVKSDGMLAIHSLSIYDRGFYKCMANNSAG
ncbi:Immunoglobulin superfamily member 10 [Manis javanica]|nr:Immunoglobulin superfamily member 10 [Manis javanica]